MKKRPLHENPIKHIAWKGDRLVVLDQRWLPRTVKFVTCQTARSVACV